VVNIASLYTKEVFMLINQIHPQKSAERKAVQAALAISTSVFTVAVLAGVVLNGSPQLSSDTSAAVNTQTLFSQPKPLGSIFDLPVTQAPTTQITRI
jgi:hypothetical protein